MGLGFWGFAFRALGDLELRVLGWVQGFRVQGLGSRVEATGFRVERVEGLGFLVQEANKLYRGDFRSVEFTALGLRDLTSASNSFWLCGDMVILHVACGLAFGLRCFRLLILMFP